MQTQTFQLKGLTCEACTKLTGRRISKINGVDDVRVDLTTQQATITASRPISPEEIKLALENTQYGVKE